MYWLSVDALAGSCRLSEACKAAHQVKAFSLLSELLIFECFFFFFFKLGLYTVILQQQQQEAMQSHLFILPEKP